MPLPRVLAPSLLRNPYHRHIHRAPLYVRNAPSLCCQFFHSLPITSAMSTPRTVHDFLMQAARSRKGSGRSVSSQAVPNENWNGKESGLELQDMDTKLEKGEQEIDKNVKALDTCALKDVQESTEKAIKKKKNPRLSPAKEKHDDTEKVETVRKRVKGSSSKVDREETSLEKMDNSVLEQEHKNIDAEKGGCKMEKVALKESLVSDRVALLTKRHYDFKPSKAAHWKQREPVPFLFLAQAFEMISCESGRIAMTDILTNVFRTVIVTTPQDLLAIVYLTVNRVAPAHHGVELGIGDAAVIKTIAETFGKSEAQVKSQLKALGDLGLVAKACRTTQRLMRKPAPLTCGKVFNTFVEIAKETGKNSQENRRIKLKSLLVAGVDCEPQYLVRLAQGNLRIGLAEQTVLVALAHALVLSENPPVATPQLAARLDEALQIIKQTYSVLPDFEKIIPVLLKVGIWKLRELCHFTPGVPVGPMLAKATKSISDIIDKFQDVEFTCEYKYDGERAQIHYLENGSVEIYSRNAECTTGKFPDVAGAMVKFKKPDVNSFVLDCEIVAYDKEADKILPFQVLSTRARKGVTLDNIKVQVCVFAFDLLYLNGRELLQEPLRARREFLHQSFVEVSKEFAFAKSIISSDLDDIQTFLTDAVNHSCEGLIIKTLDKEATYEPAKRSNNWLKLKKDYMESVGDSFDLVPIGAFHGRGKRTGVYGAFLLACYDDDKEEFQSVCKIGTGFSESVLEERSSSLRANIISLPKPYYRYGETLSVDVWFEPVEVWEVKAADLSISPVHRAAVGKVDQSKGISLRFPRLVRSRPDKTPEQATTADQVAEMYQAQKISRPSQKDNNDDED